MKKICEICGKEFETIPNGGSRKYCFECIPLEANQVQRTVYKRNAVKREGVKRLGGVCLKCVHLLEFHHINPKDKTAMPSKLISNSKIKEFFDEILKCALLCSNCHQDFHWLQAYNPDLTLEQYLENKCVIEEEKL